jgi:hypothetical protein
MGRGHRTTNTNTASVIMEPDELPDPDAAGLIPIEAPFDYEPDEIPEILAAYSTYTRARYDLS